MKIRLSEDYYFWCCEWCDSENRVLWVKVQEGTYCGACHRAMIIQNHKECNNGQLIAAGLFS